MVGDHDDERVVVEARLLEPVEDAAEGEVGVADLEQVALLRLDRELRVADPALVHEPRLRAEVGR